jgi:hypothetical protein
VKHVAETVAVAVAVVVAAAAAAAVVVVAVAAAVAVVHVPFPSSRVIAAFDSCSCSLQGASAVVEKIVEIDHDPGVERVMQMLQIDDLGEVQSSDDCLVADRVDLEVCRGRVAV